MGQAVDLVNEYSKALAARDVTRAVQLYAADAVVVRYEGIARGHEAIRAFLVGLLSAHDRFELVSIDQIQGSEDTLIWDSTRETGAGMLQETNMVVFDEDGLISRHVPLIRGYWGKT